MNNSPELKDIFFEEAFELVSRIESSALLFEKETEDKAPVHQIFRDLHTLKGSASLFNYQTLNRIAHKLEDLIEEFRTKTWKKDKKKIGLLFEAVDMIKLLLETEKSDLDTSHADMEVDRIVKMIDKAIARKHKKDKPDDETPKAAKTLPQIQKPGAPKTSVRVNAQKLDGLVDSIGELVIAHSLVIQNEGFKQLKDRQILSDVAQLGKVINDLQGQIMSLRMIPIGQTFDRMGRVLRDASVKLGKEANFFVYGENVEIDKNIADELNEILVHLIRNCIDHGIESASERKKAGKSAHGRIELRAYPSKGNIVVEVEDDGRGISEKKLIEKAKSNNFDYGKGSKNEIFKLIFEKGFSTASSVTSISGRGVGLDAVKQKLEAIRGKIEVSSTEGKGTLFTITLQPTLAIIDGMIFRVGSERMIIPTLSIEESLCPTKEQLLKINTESEAVMLRGKAYPLIRLNEVFAINTVHTNPWESLVVLARTQNRKCMILIDEIIGQQQVVVKSLGARFKKIKAVSGGAILGDGRVGLILDLDGLIDYAHHN